MDWINTFDILEHLFATLTTIKNSAECKTKSQIIVANTSSSIGVTRIIRITHVTYFIVAKVDRNMKSVKVLSQAIQSSSLEIIQLHKTRILMFELFQV